MGWKNCKKNCGSYFKNKMKILFITDNFPPEMNAPATRTFEHCKAWNKENDIEITIITGVPNFPNGLVYKGYSNKLFQTEIIEGIKVIRVWTYIAENKKTIKRTLDYISFCISSFIVGLFQKFDIIIGTSPQFFTAISAYMLSKVKRKPWIFELRDIWPESIKSVGLLKNSFLFNLLEKLELYLYKDSELVVSVTDSFKENLILRGIESSKIKIHKNGVIPENYKPGWKKKILIDRLNLQNKFIIGYIGTQGLAHGLEFILDSIKTLDDNFHFIFIGGGALNEKLVKKTKMENINNITFIDFISKNEIINYISIIDVALVNLIKSETFKMVIPSKIFENAAMEKPILLGVQGEAEKIIKEFKAGECFIPENNQDFSSKLMQIKVNLESNSEYYKSGLNKLTEKFNRNNIAKSMLKDLRTI